MEVEIWLNACFLSPWLEKILRNFQNIYAYHTCPRGVFNHQKKKNQLFHVQYLFNGLTTGN